MSLSRFTRPSAIAGILLLVFGLFIAWQASLLRVGTPASPGPGLFPFWLGLALVVLAIPITVKGGSDVGPADRPATTAASGRQIALVVTVVLATPLLLEPVGYMITMTLVTLVLLRLSRHTWRTAALVGFGAVACTYLLFDGVFGLRLPQGILGAF